MDHTSTLRKYGLFDAKVPRYTSYPPANRFVQGVGAKFQKEWLAGVDPSEAFSVYVHIPFCRRLCWFCACRTQGTTTLSPVEAYVEVLLLELAAYRAALPKGIKMRRLHLGGGTPTLLSAELMQRLLDRIFVYFDQTEDFEFSVEIDPTEAKPDVLAILAAHKMARASVGVQDFNPQVQTAIGREQSFEQTLDVILRLRENGVQSLNVDLLYGLPFQTAQSIADTLDRIVSLRADRLALYGYAHVPHVAKRQVMIPEKALPGPENRFFLANFAKDRLTALGYEALGIDHFALSSDSLTAAAKAGLMVRNFQGYTDDPCTTLVGIGASAISHFADGYVQNAVSTSAYVERVRARGLAGHKGIALTEEDAYVSALINDIMCNGQIDKTALAWAFPEFADLFMRQIEQLKERFHDLVVDTPDRLIVRSEFLAATRLIAAELDRSRTEEHQHSLAV
jgi:oxygen-independent coproporphyrinogen-3 oxidase